MANCCGVALHIKNHSVEFLVVRASREKSNDRKLLELRQLTG